MDENVPSTSGPISRFLSADHARLDDLLDRATAHPGVIDATAYTQFRAGLLKHIGMEEKLLLPDAQRRRGGEPLPIAAKLRLDHGALAALLVPPPTPTIVKALRSILVRHNAIEEAPEGPYAECERLAGPDSEELLARLRIQPEVPLAAHVDGPRVRAATQRALQRAGFEREAAGLFPEGSGERGGSQD